MRRRVSAWMAVALGLLLASAGAVASPRYYLKIDNRWYAVTSGNVEIAASSNLVDIVGAAITQLCSRTGGGLPPSGTHSVLIGSSVVDLVYANAAIRFHPTTPPVVEVRTSTGDVGCGPGVTPPQTIIDAVANPGSGVAPMFSNGFESG